VNPLGVIQGATVGHLSQSVLLEAEVNGNAGGAERINLQRVQPRWMRNLATTTQVRFSRGKSISRASIFCDHGHELAPRSRWTLVFVTGKGMINGEVAEEVFEAYKV
jgi:hypothetical protein